MANVEREILAKIADTLVEINEDYDALQQEEEGYSEDTLYLLTAKTKQLTSYFEVLEKVLASDRLSNILGAASSRADQDQKVEESFVTDEQEEPPVVSESEASGESDKSVDSVETSSEDGPVAVENIANEYQHGDPVPVLQSIEDVDEAVEELEETPSEATSVESEVEEEVQEEDGPAKPSTEKSSDESIEEEPAVSQPKAEQPAETPTPEPAKEEPSPTVSTKPTVHQVVEEAREVVIEAPAQKQEDEKQPARPLTLNEIIQQQKKAGLTNANQFKTSTQGDKILDLKSAVSLNDKLLFIKDLFNGYSLAYSEAIELLNRYDSFAEADAFLQTNYAVKNNWASKPQTVEKLYAILRKKFM